MDSTVIVALISVSGTLAAIGVGYLVKLKFYKTEVVGAEQKNKLSELQIRKEKREWQDDLEDAIQEKTQTLIKIESEKTSMRIMLEVKEGMIGELRNAVKEIYEGQGELKERLRASEERNRASEMREKECQTRLSSLQEQMDLIKASIEDKKELLKRSGVKQDAGRNG